MNRTGLTGCVFILLWGVAISPILGGGQSQQEDRRCPRCDSTGRISNEIEKPDLKVLEDAVVRCSWLVDQDSAGRGLPFIPCKRCLTPSRAKEAREEFDVLAAEIDAWRSERRVIDDNLRSRTKLIHIETEHFDLVFGLPKVTLSSRVSLKSHRAAHLYASRLEEFYTWFQELIGYDDEEARVTKHRVFLLADLRTLVKAGTDYAQIATDRSGRAVGDPSVFVTWRDKSVFKSDASFHQHLIHNMSHQLLGVYYLKIWLVERAGWLEEGLAHVCEMRLFGKAGNSCNTEQSEEDLEDDNWEPVVKKKVIARKTMSFAELQGKRSDQLNRDEHLFAWSFTDFLIARKPELISSFIKQLKSDEPLRDSLRSFYGLSVPGFDEAWQAWVLETYRLKR